ncbi:MAG: DUF1501 domain-containing protein [Candidatus Hydrogenedentes bacterium]|nr:DUF1501 domain-containing protein [Candidatus Hydrogenedentota bacterium]
MAQSNMALKIRPESAHTLVVVFLRGGADGLSMVPPAEDDAYYRARPLIGVAARDTAPLDGHFGLHPALAPLRRAYDAGDLLIVHGAGSEEDSRSHFAAQDYLEHGGTGAGGWIGRYLRENTRASGNPLASVAFGTRYPESLRAAPAAVVVSSLADIALGPDAGTFVDDLGAAYAATRLPWGGAGESVVRAIRRIETIQARLAGGTDTDYPQDPFAQQLRQAAQLIKAGAGVEAVTLDLDGWDSHVASSPLITPLMARLAAGLIAFYDDLGTDRERATVVVISEFGRRVRENASLGTDHGRGGLMMVLGGGVRGGRVLKGWNSLEADALEGPGDLPVTYNFRDVIAPIFQRHAPDLALNRVFPGYTLAPLDIM